VGRPPVISWLTDVELHPALAKKTRREELSAAGADRVRDLFRTHSSQDLYEIMPIEQEAYVQARQWMSTKETALWTEHPEVPWRRTAGLRDVLIASCDSETTRSYCCQAVKRF